MSKGITLLLAAVAAVGVGVVRDHVHHDYTRLDSLAEVVRTATALPAPPAGLSGWLRPDDRQYLAFTADGWQFWLGRGAILQGFYFRIPDLGATSIELLVRGEQGHPAPVTFELAAVPGVGDRFRVERLLRNGTPAETGRTLEVRPLTVGGRLAVSSTGAGDSYLALPPLDPVRFARLDRFTARGRLESVAGGLVLEAPGYRLGIDPDLEPGLEVFLQDLAGTGVSEDGVYYLRRIGSEGGDAPGRVHLDALELGDLFIRNETRP